MATGSEDGQERATHLLDLPGDLLAKIMFGSRNSSPNELPLASCSGYLATIERTRDRHALYCTCRAIRENAAINSCISRLRLEVCEFNMDGTEAHPPFPHLAHSLRTFPKHARPLASLLLCKLGASGHERERAEDSGWGYAGDAPFFLDVWEGLINDPQTRAVLSDLHELTLQGWEFEGDELDRVSGTLQRSCPHLLPKPVLVKPSEQFASAQGSCVRWTDNM